MASPALIASLIRDVLEGLRVFNTVDKLGIADELLQARARNIVDGLRGNYMILEFPVEAGEGAPFRHMHGCRCGNCPGEFPVVVGRRSPHALKGPCATCDRDPCCFAFYPVTHRADEWDVNEAGRGERTKKDRQ